MAHIHPRSRDCCESNHSFGGSGHFTIFGGRSALDTRLGRGGWGGIGEGAGRRRATITGELDIGGGGGGEPPPPSSSREGRTPPCRPRFPEHHGVRLRVLAQEMPGSLEGEILCAQGERPGHLANRALYTRYHAYGCKGEAHAPRALAPSFGGCALVRFCQCQWGYFPVCNTHGQTPTDVSCFATAAVLPGGTFMGDRYVASLTPRPA